METHFFLIILNWLVSHFKRGKQVLVERLAFEEPKKLIYKRKITGQFRKYTPKYTNLFFHILIKNCFNFNRKLLNCIYLISQVFTHFL